MLGTATSDSDPPSLTEIRHLGPHRVRFVNYVQVYRDRMSVSASVGWLGFNYILYGFDKDSSPQAVCVL